MLHNSPKSFQIDINKETELLHAAETKNDVLEQIKHKVNIADYYRLQALRFSGNNYDTVSR